MNVIQLVGKFLGDQIARIYEKIGLHTGDSSIHRTSAEIRVEITEGDIPSEIARQTEVERALAGKVDKIDGKELMPSPGEGLSREYYLNASGQWEKISSDALVITMTVSEDQQHFSLDENELGAYLKAYYGIDSYEDVRNPDTVHTHIGVFLKYAPYGVKYKEDGTVDNIYTIWNFIKVTRTFTEYGIPHLMAYVSEAGDDGVVTTGYYCQIDIWDRGDGVLRPSVLYSSITSNYMASKNYVDNTKAGKSDLQAHVGNTENPHRVTKSQIGLENVENTADADKPVSKPVQQALDGIAGQLQSHAADAAIHRTSAQIRAEITDANIPRTIARDADVDTKIQAHNESGEAHADLRNALANLESGTVETGSAVYAQKLGTAADSYTKTQLDAKLNRHIKDVVYDAGHAKFTFVFEDGREIVVDTPLENTVTDGRYDNETLELVLVLVSGQEIRIPVAGMTKVYTGKDTATATTTINDAGEVSVALKTGGVDAVHLSGALLSAINSHLTSTGDTKDNIATFPDQGTRTNLASGDKHAVLFGKIKRWFSDLKTVAFTGKASDLSQDAENQLVTDTEKAGWNDKYTRAEVDTKDAGKANLVHIHSRAQITDFPAALPANGGNADTVDGMHAYEFSGLEVTAEPSTPNTIYKWKSASTPSGCYGTCLVFNPGTLNKLFITDSGNNPMYYKTAAGSWKRFAMADEIPASLPANGGNADTVGNYPVIQLGRIYPGILNNIDDASGFISSGWGVSTVGNKPGEYGTILQVSNSMKPASSGTGERYIFQLAHIHGTRNPVWRTQVNGGGWSAWETLALVRDIPTSLPANGGNADTVGGRRVAVQSVDITPSQLYNNIPVYTDAGYLNAVIFKDSWVVEDSNTISDICYRISKADGYHRWCSLARLKSVLGSMPASDVPAWAKQANKPTYNINEIYDANVVWVDAGTVNRKILIANHKPEGYISRAAIGLTNPSNRFSPVTVSAGLNDNGTAWADWTFDPITGKIFSPNNSPFAFIGETLFRNPSTEIQADTILGNSQFGFGYEKKGFPISGSFISFGGFSGDYTTQIIASYKGDKMYFRTYDGDLKKWNTWQKLALDRDALKNSGDQTLSNGRFYLNVSAPEHVMMFKNATGNIGYIGFGAYPTKDLQIMNYATNRYINIAADGKLYYNQKELATTDQINNLVTLNTSQTITGAKIFTQYCDFRAGAGNSGSDMRFKEKVRPVDEVLPGLLDLKVICYEWNKEGEQKRDTFGISATELEEKGGVFEKIVHEREDEQRTKWVEYDRVGVLALKGMQEMYHRWVAEKQEMHRELADLKAELAELRGFLHELK